MPSEERAGDPARLLQLLWRTEGGPQGRRGPRQRISVDRVVGAGVQLADAEGIGAVTMRRVAEAVGLTPMAVYTYVPGKRELVDLMLDSIYLEMARPPWRTRSWRERVSVVADANRSLLAAHPWAATSASSSRPPLGPGLMAKYEHELSAFDGTGLDDVETDAALTFVLGFVQSSARAEFEADELVQRSQLDDAAWWEANAPLLAQVFDEQAYPRAVRIGSAAGSAQGGAYNAARAYEFGLQRVLDGLGTLVDARAGKGRKR